MRNLKQEAMLLIVQAINAWLLANGRSYRIAPRDVVVTERAGVMFLAFQVTPDNEARP